MAEDLNKAKLDSLSKTKSQPSNQAKKDMKALEERRSSVADGT